MISYEKFKEIVVEKFLSYMPEKYQNKRVEIQSVNKVNCVRDGLVLVDEYTNISPTMYVDDMYRAYFKTGDLRKVLYNAAIVMDDAFCNIIEVPKFDVNEIQNNIIFQIVNTAWNQELLGDVPHREFLDLSIIYRWIVSLDEPGSISSVVINNDIAEMLGLSETQMFELALKNTKKLMPPITSSINDLVNEYIPEQAIDIPDEFCMYTISNDRGINGAVSILYEDIIYELAEKLGTNLYVIPSSVQEVIAVPVNMAGVGELSWMLNTINKDHVAVNERLSNQVYHYDKGLRKLTIAKNNDLNEDGDRKENTYGY